MPTYEYDCEACNNQWEAEQRITEDALKDCPKCGAPKARRLISGSRFVLKGSGWYADGYGSSKPAAKSGDSGDGKPADSKPAESKPADSKAGESKPSEAKPASKPTETKSDSGSGTKGTTAA
jgi:putative FmdB family regulatory protein